MTGKTYHRWIVMGGCMETIAHLHILAADKDEALFKWHQHFGERVTGWTVDATNIDIDRPDMARYWENNGYSYYFGGYTY